VLLNAQAAPEDNVPGVSAAETPPVLRGANAETPPVPRGANAETPPVPRGANAETPRVARGAKVLCLGEALVDLIGEQHVQALTEVRRFSPHFGGAVANVAVVAARTGARIALAGGVGDDAWGTWLSARLRREGVDASLFELISGVATPFALVSIADSGEPSYQIYGEAIGTVVHALADRVEQAVSDSAGLFISSNTLVGADERSVTMRAREVALELGRPVIFDANLRLHRWSSRADAAASANACVPGAVLVRANAAEAELMTGESDPERAASALAKAGAQIVVLTLGADGAILRGALRADAAAVQADVVSTVGAGDVMTGTLLARLAMSGFYVSSVAASLREAMAAATAACQTWGALD
jgi:fructokinase